MADQEFLDLSWKEIFTAANDRVLEPTHVVDIPLSTHRCQIARMQLAVAFNRLGGLLEHIGVADHYHAACKTYSWTVTSYTSLTTCVANIGATLPSCSRRRPLLSLAFTSASVSHNVIEITLPVVRSVSDR